jgi:hypothetical protein
MLELIEGSRCLFVDLVLDFDFLDFFDWPVFWVVYSNSYPVLMFRIFGGSRVPVELAFDASLY